MRRDRVEKTAKEKTNTSPGWKRGQIVHAIMAAAEPGGYTAVPVLMQGSRLRKIEEPFPVQPGAATVRRQRRRAVLILPRKDVILKELRFPSAEPKLVQRMLENELHQYLPWPAEEALVSFDCRADLSDGFGTASVYMTKRAPVDAHVAALRELGYSVERVDISTLCLARYFAAEASAAVALFSDGACDYARMEAGQVVFSRGAPSAPDPMAALALSVSLDKRKNGPLEQGIPLTVCGCPPELLASFKALPDFGGFTIRSADEAPSVPLKTDHVISAGAALGFAGQYEGVNLLPQEELRRLNLRTGARAAFKAALLICWLLALLGATATTVLHFERTRLDRINQEIASLQKDVGNLEAKSEQLTLLAKERTKISLPLRVALELYNVLPPGIAINHMRLDMEGTLLLGGEGGSYTSVLACIGQLQQSKLFRDITLLYSSKSSTAENALVDFKVQCRLAAGNLK